MQVEELRCHLQLLSQPEVQHLFHRPGRFSEILQSDHPAAAFEGMYRAAEGGQNLDVMRLSARAVAGCRGCCREPRPLPRGRSPAARRRLLPPSPARAGWFPPRAAAQPEPLRPEGGHGRVDLRRRVTAGSQRREYVLGLLPQFLVGNQVGVLLQCRQVLRRTSWRSAASLGCSLRATSRAWASRFCCSSSCSTVATSVFGLRRFAVCSFMRPTKASKSTRRPSASRRRRSRPATVAPPRCSKVGLLCFVCRLGEARSTSAAQ
jgi:hypothetical protein